MGMSDLETYIQVMRKDVAGDVLSRSRTMDALLDLRLEAAGRDETGLLTTVGREGHFKEHGLATRSGPGRGALSGR